MLIAILFFAAMVAAPAPWPEEPRTPTPVGRAELRAALREAHLRVFGAAPNVARLAMAEAQCRYEGPGLNHNLGAIGATAGQRWFRLGGSRFRAYVSHLEGAIGYWEHLKKSCASALAAFDSGSPEAAAQALGRCHYYRVPERLYTEGLASLFSPG